MTTVQVVAGFSPVNRWLMYTSVMLAPAQFAAGLGSICPSSLGFLAYNFYTQISWYFAIQRHQLHAISLVMPHYNLVFWLSYLGGVSSGSPWIGTPLGLGTAGLLILNNISSWKSWAFCQPDGFGVYQFFFFGWRTLSPGWHKFFEYWQIGDSVFTATAVVGSILMGILASKMTGEDGEKLPWWSTAAMIPVGAAIMMLFQWPLILWTELIVDRNHIESPTDWIAVWLFIATIANMLLPAVEAGVRKARKG